MRTASTSDNGQVMGDSTFPVPRHDATNGCRPQASRAWRRHRPALGHERRNRDRSGRCGPETPEMVQQIPVRSVGIDGGIMPGQLAASYLL